MPLRHLLPKSVIPPTTAPLGDEAPHELSVMNELREVRNAVEEIRAALLGNDFGQKGLVARMKSVEEVTEKHDRKFLTQGTVLAALGVILVFTKDVVLTFFTGRK